MEPYWALVACVQAMYRRRSEGLRLRVSSLLFALGLLVDVSLG